jgi:hypothetical protein
VREQTHTRAFIHSHPHAYTRTRTRARNHVYRSYTVQSVYAQCGGGGGDDDDMVRLGAAGSAMGVSPSAVTRLEMRG